MPGTIIVDDEFTGLALNASIDDRVPPISNSSFGFNIDPGQLTGGGSNDVKFNGNGTAAKLRTLSIDGATQVTIDTKGGNEWFSIFTRDNQSTPYPRYGYFAEFKPSAVGGISGTFTAGISNDYAKAILNGIQDIPWTFATNNINVVTLESIGSNHRVIINNAVAATFTDSTYINASLSNRCGVVYHSVGNPSILRMERFSVLDSIVVTQTVTYTIVRVS